ncbi:zinc finger protein 865-like [Ischnura elegans]|uniref:zinc finger protein 865-like n=1 Tax=Ischnura elegans TaxID=197161 RepID=UPI001ED88CE7|nr:zinc finger protein 865-like [Ischnura elegans]
MVMAQTKYEMSQVLGTHFSDGTIVQVPISQASVSYCQSLEQNSQTLVGNGQAQTVLTIPDVQLGTVNPGGGAGGGCDNGDVGKNGKEDKRNEEEKTTDGLVDTSNEESIKTYAPVISTSWQSLAVPGTTVADYLSRLPSSTLPITLQHFLKYSTVEGVKKELGSSDIEASNLVSQALALQLKKKKKKKKKYGDRRARAGEIRLTTALDGSTLFCCPECHMAYPEQELLEQHIIGHKVERRFICDICGAGLKRKEHLDRHKQGHNPDRPYICTVCLKAFKRNEHLSRHFIIHSGEKGQVCPECSKAFYRKDHLRKHMQTHIAKRVKAELSQQMAAAGISPAHNVSTMLVQQQALDNNDLPSMASLASIANMVSVGTMTPVTAVALMPDGVTLPILT